MSEDGYKIKSINREISISVEVIASKIYLIRNLKVMLDSDLAELYQVETRRLNEQIKRNSDRFPADFMFQLTDEEWINLKSQNATSSLADGKAGWGGRRKLPYAFTEHGVLMLSSVLNSERSIAVNIHIMRVFTKLREMLITHKDLLIKMNELESKVSNHDKSIKQIFNYLKQLIKQEEPREPIGFKSQGKK